MQLDDNKAKEYMKRILISRMRILDRHGFYGLLLMKMKYGLDLECETAYTDGDKIMFSPKFLDKLSNQELDFVLMHEILHAALRHCFRCANRDPELFNIACDIVVNSNILKSNNMDLSTITIRDFGGPAMHLAPNKEEGYLYTAEEVYEMLLGKIKKIELSISFDDHTHWGMDGNFKDDEIDQAIIIAVQTIKKRIENSGIGELPAGVERVYKELTDSTVNWRIVLKNFITREKNDYSFTPPDRRFNDFFLPDFNETEEKLKINILFEIDTSSSISDKDLGLAYSEIKGFIEESNDDVNAYLGFYDTNAYDPVKFENVDDMLAIKPIGGGGTSCLSVFKKLDKYIDMIGGIDYIVFITDGYDDFCDEKYRKDIPVLWIINNNETTPPWGMVARIK